MIKCHILDFVNKKRVRYESLTPHSFLTDVGFCECYNTQNCRYYNSGQHDRRLKI